MSCVGLRPGEGIRKARLSRDGKMEEVKGGLDFGKALFDTEVGRRCILREEEVERVEKTPIMECSHRSVRQCHFTYITQYIPTQEEICEDSFHKTCQITFRQTASTEVVRSCLTPVSKVCEGEGPEVCRTVYETSCMTSYVERQQGKDEPETMCQKMPVELCGAGCSYEEGVEECHDKNMTSVVDIPEEVCDLNPEKTCRLTTRLVPKLSPVQEYSTIPRETCQITFSKPEIVRKAIMIKWCLEVEELDDEENAVVIEGEDPVFDARLVLEVNDKKRVKKGTNKESRRKPKSEFDLFFGSEA